MNIKIWGCRGSLSSPGIENDVYGGNTSCVEINHGKHLIILDGGSGIRRLSNHIDSNVRHIDILLTHLHLDHIIGLGFFAPFYNPEMTINIWGPASSNISLSHRLGRYFSPPLSPIHLKEFPCQLNIKEIDKSEFKIGDLNIKSEYICHPGATLGFRFETSKSVFTYLPDHEPVLGSIDFPNKPDWTSGYSLAENADLLFHDGQYDAEEYKTRVGWGHSSMEDAIHFGNMCQVKKMLLFHHDPSHSDTHLENMLSTIHSTSKPNFELGLCAEGRTYHLPD